MNPDATMNSNAFDYEGMDRFVCREKLVSDLKEKNLLISIEEMVHSVGHSERSDAVVEPYLSRQWFVKMRPLADRVLENQKDSLNKVNFVPERYEKIMNHWMEITYDWCISRQLWWGHRIPAWYKGEEVYVGLEPPKEDGWVQDNDVLDTWFSSALWPFSTLGWPNSNTMLDRYYPNNVLVTGYDIIPFWVNRMTFQGLHFTNKRPFKDCLIHGLIRDKQGRKMSKSLGNGVDPMDVIDKYGADSLRFFLSTNASLGMDLRYDEEKVKSTWNFVNKLWNASRYVLMNCEDIDNLEYNIEDLTISDKWIISKLQKTINVVRKHMEQYDFNVVGSTLYSFIWDDFCDWYIELSKCNMNETTKKVLIFVLTDILKMLHPFMPYVTDEIYNMLPVKDCESILISKYPIYNENYNFINDFDLIIDLIKNVRKAKLENNIKDYTFVYDHELIENNIELISKMLKLNDISLISKYKNETLSNVVIPFVDSKVYLYYDGSINEKNNLENNIKERDRLIASIERRKKLLSNSGYVNKAPEAIVNKEREDLKREEHELEVLNLKIIM